MRLIKTLLATAALALLMLGGLFALVTAVLGTAAYCALRSTFRAQPRPAMPTGRAPEPGTPAIDVEATEVASDPLPERSLVDETRRQS